MTVVYSLSNDNNFLVQTDDDTAALSFVCDEIRVWWWWWLSGDYCSGTPLASWAFRLCSLQRVVGYT